MSRVRRKVCSEIRRTIEHYFGNSIDTPYILSGIYPPFSKVADLLEPSPSISLTVIVPPLCAFHHVNTTLIRRLGGI